jgi:hypothetical protein
LDLLALLARSFQQRWSGPPLSPLVWGRYLVATLPVTVASCKPHTARSK